MTPQRLSPAKPRNRRPGALAASVLLLMTMALPVIKKLVTRAAERRGAGAD